MSAILRVGFPMVCGSREKAEALMEVLQNEENFGFIAVSLGYFDTLISCSGSSISANCRNRSHAHGDDIKPTNR